MEKAIEAIEKEEQEVFKETSEAIITGFFEALFGDISEENKEEEED